MSRRSCKFVRQRNPPRPPRCRWKQAAYIAAGVFGVSPGRLRGLQHLAGDKESSIVRVPGAKQTPKQRDSAEMNVLHVGKFYPPHMGGIERHMQAMAEGQSRRTEVSVLVASDGPRTVTSVVNGVFVTRVGSLGVAASQPVCPGLAWHIRARLRLTSSTCTCRTRPPRLHTSQAADGGRSSSHTTATFSDVRCWAALSNRSCGGSWTERPL